MAAALLTTLALGVEDDAASLQPDAVLPAGIGTNLAKALKWDTSHGGRGLAEMHNSKCQQALANTQAFCEAYWSDGRCTNATWQVFVSPSAKVAYLKTAKAASVSIKDYMYRKFDPIKKLSVMAEDLPSDVFTFTFVRDPLERAFAGYAEVDGVHRLKASEGKPLKERAQAQAAGIRYVNTPRSKDGGEARFLAYLDDLTHGRLPPEWEFSHSRPVADHLRTGGKHLSFVGRLEDLREDWPAWQQKAGLPARQIEAMPPEDHVGKTAEYLEAEAVPRTPKVLRKVCEIYAADYACFGYALPAACSGSEER